MAAFIILVNGQQICSVGLGEDDTCGVHLNWIGCGDDGLLVSAVGGVMGGESRQWNLPEPQVGDEITIRIVESAETTPPSKREPYVRADRSVG